LLSQVRESIRVNKRSLPLLNEFRSMTRLGVNLLLDDFNTCFVKTKSVSRVLLLV
jgi:EAL domain-containing protein (putative c-di-GMP-specific phosphodiesterase class I)